MFMALLAGLLVGCSALTAPVAVRATLEQIEALGYDCGAGVADNVPSGLFEWKCSGSVAGNRASVDVEGNEDGVAGLTLDVNSIDPAISRSEFRRLVTAVSLLIAHPGLSGALDTWTGAQDPRSVDGARVNALCDATQCIVFIGFVDAPIQPSQVP